MKKENTAVNLKDLVKESTPVVDSKATIVTEAFEKFSLLGDSHGFGKAIKIANDYKIRSIDSLLVGSKGGVVRIPLKGLTYATLRFSVDKIRSIIMESERLNPVVELKENIASSLDKIILEDKFKGDKEGYEKALNNLLGIKDGAGIKTGKIIKDVVVQTDGQIYVIFHNHLLIGNKVSNSLLSSLPENEQNRIYKDAIPESIIRLRKSGSLEIADRKRLNVGRIGYDLALPIDANELFNSIILPSIIVDKGFKKPSLDPNGKSKLREVYSKAIKVGKATVAKDFVYFPIETLHNRIEYDLLINKSNFVCCNLSFKNEMFTSLLKEHIIKDYISFIDTTKSLEIKSGMTDVEINNLMTIRKEYANSLNLSVPMVPLSEVSTFRTLGGKPLTELFKIDKYNTPLYISVIDMSGLSFKEESKTNPLAGSLLFRMAEKSRVAIDYDKLSLMFDKYIINRDPIVSSSNIDITHLGLIPDLKKSMLHMLTSDSENELYSDYNVSINSDSESIAFAINIGIDLVD